MRDHESPLSGREYKLWVAVFFSPPAEAMLTRGIKTIAAVHSQCSKTARKLHPP
jgi:hypothetical protein